MATSIKYLSVNGKNGKTTANKIPVIAKCLALSSVIFENFDVKFAKNLNLTCFVVFLIFLSIFSDSLALSAPIPLFLVQKYPLGSMLVPKQNFSET